MAAISSLHRTLDQELIALMRGVSLECLTCGEFVMHARGGSVFCPECCSQLADQDALESDLRNAALEFGVQAG
jgi:Zn finger protein HypA/HybF involved in hydrogenase expression